MLLPMLIIAIFIGILREELRRNFGQLVWRLKNICLNIHLLIYREYQIVHN